MSLVDIDISPWESEATLTYLTNPVYKTDVSRKQKSEDEIKQEEAQDRKFYRKRIMELTRNMFKGETPDKSVRNAFDDYVRTCIIHLKTIDMHDILQGDYPKDINEKSKELQLKPLDIEETTKKSMGKTIETTNSLDSFVTKKTHVKKENPPQKKTINLKEPALRMKGIKAKKQKKNKK